MRWKGWSAGASFALALFFGFSDGARAQEEIEVTDSSVVAVADSAGRLIPLEGSVRPAGATRFWVDPAAGSLRQGDLSGGRPLDLLRGLEVPYGLSYDPRTGTFLWTSAGASAVQAFVLGDSGPRNLRSEFEEPFSLMVTGKASETTYAAAEGQVVAVTTAPETEPRVVVLLTYDPELSPVHGLALDDESGALYVGDGFGRMVQRIDLATGEVTNLAFVVETFGDSTGEVVR